MAQISINTVKKVVPIIYAYTTPEIFRHNGWTKIGYSEQDAQTRIGQQTHTADVSFTEEWHKNAVFDDGSGDLFHDSDFHAYLTKNGIERKEGTEWFRIDPTKAKHMLDDFRENHGAVQQISNVIPYKLRAEQQEAVNKAADYFSIHEHGAYLFNAKPRFGKTLAVYDLCKTMKLGKVLIVTNRPAIANSWHEDYCKFLGIQSGYAFVSEVSALQDKTYVMTREAYINSLDNENGTDKCIEFVSLQDMKGSQYFGGNYDKLGEVRKISWDILVIDEAHEGTTTSLGEDVIKNTVKENTKFLALSGTPFNILSDYEDNIYTWDYVMEQQNKKQWDEKHFGDSNPYDELPELRIYTYDLGKIISDKRYVELEDKAFNFREFFRVWTGDIRSDRIAMPSTSEIGDFYHENDVKSFLDLITKSDSTSQYPYSTEEYRDLFKHSLWMVPGVKEAKALSKMMKSHPVFGNGAFDIVNVAGDGDEEEKTDDALKKVRQAINNAGNDGYTITLSCGKLTTGVTVPEWTAVFMLSGSFSTSAANYLQTIFRVQSPCNKNGMIKQCCYVFDFAPDRTLKMVAEAAALSTKAGKASDTDKRIMGEFLNYCPVISVDGTEMKEYDTNKLLQQLKRAYAERAVRNGFDDNNLYNDELLKLDGMALEEFKKLKGIVGSSKAAPKSNEIDVNNQGFTDEEYEEIERISKKPKKERSPEEEARLKEIREKKKQKYDAISILRAISIRMPLLIYGADVDIDEDFTLEKLLDDKIVDPASWTEFMPTDVTKSVFKRFIKYYDSEIFVAAGRSIRNKVKGADELNPTERIKAITQLFAGFKNPDKETVLTPWRVVNMHMSDCLGGYDFYDVEHNTLIEMPRFVNQGTVTADTLANSNAQILEINSKTGLYPLYVTYSIYRTKCTEYAEDELTLELQEKLWNDTVENNIFVVCKTPMAKQITKRTLVGYKNVKVNAHYFEDLINMLKNKPKQFKDRVLKPSYWKKEGVKEMKFDAIVGNPPYQESTENTSDKPIYHLFMESAFNISDKVSFITPARFLFNAGKTPKDFNNKILSDKHFKVVWYKAKSADVFDNVDIKGGVAVTFRDANQEFGEIGIYSDYEELNTIKNKVEKNQFIPLSDLVYAPESYKLTSKIHADNDWVKDRLSKGHLYDITTNIFDKLPELFFNEKISDEYVGIYGRENNERIFKWIKKDYISEHENLNNYKVFVPKSNGSGSIGEVLSTPVIGHPVIGHTQTFISMGSFKTEFEANSLLKYIKTKFTRCLLGILKVTQDNKKSVWKLIPVEDFTAYSDIDWSKSVAEIDKQLYAKYGLTDDEIAFIEEKIKPME